MRVNNAEAVWEGTLREGQGTMKLGSGAYEGKYSYATRFESAAGTNPEELIGAAHAGCFSMALSGNLVRAGFKPEMIRTRARIHMDQVNGQPTISTIELETEARVPGIDQAQFQEQANAAKQGCPVSRALAGVDIRLKATLLS